MIALPSVTPPTPPAACLIRRAETARRVGQFAVISGAARSARVVAWVVLCFGRNRLCQRAKRADARNAYGFNVVELSEWKLLLSHSFPHHSRKCKLIVQKQLLRANLPSKAESDSGTPHTDLRSHTFRPGTPGSDRAPPTGGDSARTWCTWPRSANETCRS
jgi:hypothetical protein